MKLKRLLALFVGIALIMFFTLPSMLFGDSANTITVDQDPVDDWVVTDDTRFDGDSFEVQEADPTGSPGDPNDGEVMDVYCLDWIPDGTQGNGIHIGDNYDEANPPENHVEDLVGNDNWVTDNFEENPLPNPGETESLTDEMSEDAIEILSSVATGGTEVEDQLAVWSYTDNFNENDDANAAAIEDAVSRIVEANRDLDATNDVNISELNDIDITLEGGAVTLNSSGQDIIGKEITVTMEEPLVPGMTDEGKTVNLYILGGSINVSFSSSLLETDTTAIMTDVVDGLGDHDGIANTSRYYYYYWGPAYDPSLMIAVIGGWVDIDEDTKLDTNNPDMNYVPDIDIVVENEAALNDVDPNNDTYSLTTSDIDNTTVPGGTMLIPMELSINPGEWVYNDDNQRLVVKAYEEPGVIAEQSNRVIFPYSASFDKDFEGTPSENAEFDIYADDGTGNPTGVSLGHDSLSDDGSVDFSNLPPGNYVIVETFTPPGYSTMGNILITIAQDGTVSGLPEGSVKNDPTRYYMPFNGSITLNKSGLDATDTAGFTLYDSNGVAVGGEKTVTGNGSVKWSNLPKDTYKIVETTIPAGYTQMADITGIVVGSAQLDYSFDRVNTKKTTTKKTTTTTTPGVIEVLGIQELPFTGMNPAIPISGISSIFAGGLMLMLSSIKRRFRRK